MVFPNPNAGAIRSALPSKTAVRTELLLVQILPLQTQRAVLTLWVVQKFLHLRLHLLLTPRLSLERQRFPAHLLPCLFPQAFLAKGRVVERLRMAVLCVGAITDVTNTVTAVKTLAPSVAYGLNYP